MFYKGNFNEKNLIVSLVCFWADILLYKFITPEHISKYEKYY